MIDEDVSFPLRVAAVDMGSNAIRFLVAEFANQAQHAALASERVPVRLGHGVYLSGRLEAAAMDAAVATLERFRRQMEELGVEHYRAVATSAVRESKNGDEFVERVRTASGIDLEPISGSEETRLVHLAVANRLPLGRRRWLLVDLGGGSVEVSLVDHGGTIWSESHTMGSVRLLEVLTEAGADPGRFRRLLEEYVSVLRVPAAVGAGRIAGYIATGGNIETLARLAGARPDPDVSRLPVERLRAVIEQLAAMSYRERVVGLGLREDRADVVLPAAFVYLRLAELCRAEQIIVPNVGVREGVVLDLVDGLTRSRGHADRQAQEVLAGALTVGRKYHVDEAHARHVAELALALFDQLQPLHNLAGADRKVLQAAALLHNIGQFVGFKSHHKHSFYLISNTELPNFSQREMRLVATVARYHRGADPTPHHHPFADLPEADRPRVLRLVALLRLAVALDRDHLQRARALQVKIGSASVTLHLEASGGLLLEGWSLEKKSRLFADVFSRKIRVRFAGGEVDGHDEAS